MKRPVAVCGGGHLAHAVAAVMAAGGQQVHVLTRRPEAWRREIRLEFDNLLLLGRLARVSANPADVLPRCGMVVLVLPAFARSTVLRQIAPFLREDMWVGALPGAGGFDDQARKTLPGHRRIFGSARTPYICRTIEYGARVRVTGIATEIRIAAVAPSDAKSVARSIGAALGMPALALSTYDAVNLTPSNPIVHPCRIVSFFEGRSKHARASPGFYRDWDAAASRLLLACDDELDVLRRRLHISERDVPPVRLYYGIHTVRELTARIRTLRPLREIEMPLHRDGDSVLPVMTHRYVTEDFDYGLMTAASLARKHGVRTPSIDAMLSWRAAQRD